MDVLVDRLIVLLDFYRILFKSFLGSYVFTPVHEVARLGPLFFLNRNVVIRFVSGILA